MKKIPTIFKRNPGNMRELIDEAHPDCLWVFDGEGFATRKYDGVCCAIRHGRFLKRREVKPGVDFPVGFQVEEVDEVTGKAFGWVPVGDHEKEDRWFREAFEAGSKWPDGTYEAIDPKFQGNPERCGANTLLLHRDAQVIGGVPRTMDGLKDWLVGKDIEGVVFHHPDGRMGKIKKRDFGMKRTD